MKKLALAWAFQTERTIAIKASPLLVDGILYFTVPENLWAVDARSGTHRLALHLSENASGAYRTSRRSYVQELSITSYLLTHTLVSLNSKDGSVRWTIEVGDTSKGYWTSMAPSGRREIMCSSAYLETSTI